MLQRFIGISALALLVATLFALKFAVPQLLGSDGDKSVYTASLATAKGSAEPSRPAGIADLIARDRDYMRTMAARRSRKGPPRQARVRIAPPNYHDTDFGHPILWTTVSAWPTFQDAIIARPAPDNPIRWTEPGQLTALLAGLAEDRPVPATSSKERPGVRLVRRAPARSLGPLMRAHTDLVAFETAPFPYAGSNPRFNSPFLNLTKGRKGRRTRSGRVYWEDETFGDPRVLLHIPRGFDARKPGVMVLFFHGHGATLERDVRWRQKLPEQIDFSRMNAVLVAPQFAVNARDSSAGNFWDEGGARRFLDEAANKLSRLHGDPDSEITFLNMPVIVVAYSGGYVPAAWTLHDGEIETRVAGVVLLDALYGEVDKFAQWIRQRRSTFFVSAYAGSTRRGNARLRAILDQRNIPYATRMPELLRPGEVVFLSVNARHRDYVTYAWTNYPISDILRRLTPVRRPPDLTASLR